MQIAALRQYEARAVKALRRFWILQRGEPQTVSFILMLLSSCKAEFDKRVTSMLDERDEAELAYTSVLCRIWSVSDPPLLRSRKMHPGGA